MPGGLRERPGHSPMHQQQCEEHIVSTLLMGNVCLVPAATTAQVPKVPSTATLWPLLDLKQTMQQPHEFFAATCASNPSEPSRMNAPGPPIGPGAAPPAGGPLGTHSTALPSPARSAGSDASTRMSGSAPAWHHHFGYFFFYKSAFKYFLFCNKLFYIEFAGGGIWLIKFFFNFVAQKKSL